MFLKIVFVFFFKILKQNGENGTLQSSNGIEPPPSTIRLSTKKIVIFASLVLGSSTVDSNY